MSISKEAAVAAAYALFLDANPDSELQWHDIGFHDQDELIRTATKALEAAASHMLADVYDEAWADARVTYTALFTGRNIPERFTIYNPYRTAK